MRLAIGFVLSLCAFAQQPQFEVASIKPVTVGDSFTSGITTGHGKIDAENVTLKRCIIGAYGVSPSQVVGGPDWLDSDRFHILAKAAQPTDSDAELMRMLQSLLAERFHLAIHRETRPLQAYVLEVAKGGSKLEKVPDGESSTSSSHGQLVARNTSMDLFAHVLAREVNLPVVDQTALAGSFNFTLKWTPEKELSRPDAGPSIFTALQEQLGLRLHAQKTPLEVIVIDRAERPTEN
ncbi:MAG TPA: TIGR03435 family protein [Gemmatimonadales bacterium]|nr:TIGR03435 family protein [Gemmatimonadales bacterium]